MKKTRHILGISGGKDSAALAIYMRDKHPEIDIEYYTCDTGRELAETYQLIDRLEIRLSKKITRLVGNNQEDETPAFDFFLEKYKGFLPSTRARWCTRTLKIQPFEQFVGSDNIVSYVGIRGDEDREGYISKKPNIQSIFPFRKNIWSEDVITKLLHSKAMPQLCDLYTSLGLDTTICSKEISARFTIRNKADALLAQDAIGFNSVVFQFLKTTKYPLGLESDYSLIRNTDNLGIADIFNILETSGVGVPSYYKLVSFDANGKTGTYARSRSGCFFCFYQQKIEWIWLLEQHPELYAQAAAYEKDGFTWIQNESLHELAEPSRVLEIKLKHIKKQERLACPQTANLFLDSQSDNDEDREGCASCFI